MSTVNTLSNDQITVQVSDFGAELVSLKDNSSNCEYIWQADAKIWARHAPILFPFVGSHLKREYTYHNRVYSIGQHGFARDMEFTLEEDTTSMLNHRLCASEETKQKYPFDFQLEVKHTLKGRTIIVEWTVVNPSKSKEMYFGIGAHPAFMCPIREGKVQTDYKLQFDVDGPLTYLLIGEGGVSPTEHQLILDNGSVQITENFFEHDALIFDNPLFNKVSIVDENAQPYVTLTSEGFPSYGIWSIPGAPFVCLEPWYGRSDNEGFCGTLEEKYLINHLKPLEQFRAAYCIEV